MPFVQLTALTPAPELTFLHIANILKDALSDLTTKLALISTDILKIETSSYLASCEDTNWGGLAIAVIIL